LLHGAEKRFSQARKWVWSIVTGIASQKWVWFTEPGHACISAAMHTAIFMDLATFKVKSDLCQVLHAHVH
jgi:hypothetical protein